MVSSAPRMLLKRGFCALIVRSSKNPAQRVVSRTLMAAPSQSTNLAAFHHHHHCSCCSPRSPHSTTRRFLSNKDNKNDQLDPTLDDVTVISTEDAKLAMDAASETTYADGLTNLPGTGGKSGQKQLAIVFTCTVCNTRSAKQFTEQAYRNGVVLVRCPGCENLHLIADRLGVFQDQGEDGQGWDIEKAMASIGENVKAVTNDNVLELTVEDVVGADKMQEAMTNERSGEADKR